MTTVTSTARPRSARNSLAGTGNLVRLALRRERIALVVWIYGITAATFSVAFSLANLYPTAAERAALAAGITSNSALLVLTGPVPSTSIGGLTAWRMGVLGGVLVALMAILTVIRRTRADEESGRTELLASTVVGRAAPLAAAATVAGGASLVVGVLSALALMVRGESAHDSVMFGAALAGVGLVFTAVAAVAAQLVESSRSATGIAAAVLGAAFAVRAAGDVAGGLHWLTWLSPLGWIGHVGAFGADNAAVLLLFLATAGAGLGAAGILLQRRDIGLALLPARLGPARGGLRGPAGLALRLQRGLLLGWLAGYVFFGAIMGGIAADAGKIVGGNPQMAQIIAAMGGSAGMVNAFLGAFGGIAGLIAAIYGISAALRLRAEEAAGRAEPVLATAVSRTRWMAGHLVFALLGPAIILLVAGLVAGLIHGARINDVPHGLSLALQAMLVQIPAVLVMAALAAALFGLAPRLTGIAWGALGVALLLGQLGPLLHAPQWLMDISPFTHVPKLPGQPMVWTPVAVLLLIAAGLVVAGLAGLRRRDVSGS